MVAPLDAATRQSIIEQAQAIAAQQGISPEQALWNYAQGQGLSASDVDTYMGFPAGATQNWAVLNGQAPAPQGNFNPTVQSAPPPPVPPAPVAPPPPPAVSPTVTQPATPTTYSAPPTPAHMGVTPTPAPAAVKPLSEAERAQVVQQAQAIAMQQGISPEQALLNYAKANNLSNADVDTYMGWPSNTTASWAAANPAPAPVTPTPAPVKTPVQPLDAATRESIVQQAQAVAGSQNISPEQALYNYAQTNKIPNEDVDTYMGWPTGTTSAWANKTTPVAPVKTASELAASVAPKGVYALSPAERAEVTRKATEVAGLQGIIPERALYNYADANKIGVQDVDTYMGWNQGTTKNWATNNVPGFVPPTALAPSAPPTPAPPPGPLTTVPTQPAQPQYQMPVLNSLYQNQQQRMTSEAPRFNFQLQQPGALTNVISNT